MKIWDNDTEWYHCPFITGKLQKVIRNRKDTEDDNIRFK